MDAHHQWSGSQEKLPALLPLTNFGQAFEVKKLSNRASKAGEQNLNSEHQLRGSKNSEESAYGMHHAESRVG
jgi:hypothetical protein